MRDPAVEHLHRRGRPHPRVPRRRAGRRSSAASTRWRTTSSRSSPSTCAQGEPVRVEKMVALLHLARPRDQRARWRAAGRHVLRYPDFAEALERARGGVGRSCGEVCDVELPRERARAAAAAAPHRARPAGLLAAHRRPRRGRAGPRAQRRGLPRARVLGRALRLSVPQLPAARDHPRAADVPLPPARRGAGGGPRGRLPGRDVPVAERQRRHRGDPGRPPQPAVGPAGSPTSATTSATSTPRSSTTSGSTTRPPTTWSSCATTAPR